MPPPSTVFTIRNANRSSSVRGSPFVPSTTCACSTGFRLVAVSPDGFGDRRVARSSLAERPRTPSGFPVSIRFESIASNRSWRTLPATEITIRPGT
jgi:hypothetical protein